MAFEGLMKGKRGLIMGVANERSIAWGIAQVLAEAGAELAFTYQGDAFKKRVLPLVAPLKPAAVLDCDVTDQGSLDFLFEALAKVWGELDFVVHAVAFSDKEQLKGRYVDTTLRKLRDDDEHFLLLVHRGGRARRKTDGQGRQPASLSLTYGAEKVMPHYNVMGVAKAALEASVRYLAEDLGKKAIRVNSISAGPIKTLAASGVGDFRYILKWNEYNSPLRRTVSTAEVGSAALFLLSDLGKAVTGECLHVDAGYHIIGMKAPDAPDIVVGKNED